MIAAPPVRRLALADGRGLAHRAYGPTGGAPLLFVPGAASGSFMRFGEKLLEGRGLRLLSVDRPGLGSSDADDGKSLASVGDDLRQLAATLGGPVPVVANSQGAPFALAATLAGASSRLVLVSPVDEVAHRATTALLPWPLRELVAAVAADPDEAAARFAGFTPESFLDFVLGGHPPSDAAVFSDEGFHALLRAVLDDGFLQGPDGYVRDTVLAMLPWDLDLDALNVPVIVLFGADDTSHSPDLGLTLAARIPMAERIVVPGVGGSLLWARPELVLDAALGEPLR